MFCGDKIFLNYQNKILVLYSETMFENYLDIFSNTWLALVNVPEISSHSHFHSLQQSWYSFKVTIAVSKQLSYS